jgi:outer membrane protein OmpA-like peptidoglycan-associated protein
MATVQWLSDTTSWTGFLRGQGFSLEIADDLRVASLAELLHEEGIEIVDADAAARWFAPILCRNADEQQSLTGLLAQWQRIVFPEPRPPLPPDRAVVRAIRITAALDARWWTLLSMALLALLAAFLLSGPDQRLRIKPPVDAKMRGMSSTPSPSSNNSSIPPTETTTSNFSGQFGLALSAAVFFPFVVWLASRRQRRAVLLRGLSPRDAQAGSLDVAVSEMPLFRRTVIRPALAELMHHQVEPSDAIDGIASVAATTLAAGFVQLVRGVRRTLPEYLFLVDSAGTQDSMGTLADLIVTRLRDNGLVLERFDYYSDPRRLQRVDENGVPADTVELEALRASHSRHRVILLSDGSTTSNTTTGHTREWINALCGWDHVALLTPLPTSQWGPREQDLARLGFCVAEATPRGLAELGRQFCIELPQYHAIGTNAFPPPLDRRLARNQYVWLLDKTPNPEMLDELLLDLKAALGRQGFLYLAALAAFPAIDPKLTLTLGSILADDNGQPVLTEERFANLSRLPWLRQSRLPNWLRLALLSDLESKSPEAAERTRAAWTKLLDPSRRGQTADVLDLGVVREAYPGLSRLVAQLLKPPRNYREALLIAFLKRNTLPELSTPLQQGSVAQLLQTRISVTDAFVLAAGLLLAGAAYRYGDGMLNSVSIAPPRSTLAKPGAIESVNRIASPAPSSSIIAAVSSTPTPIAKTGLRDLKPVPSFVKAEIAGEPQIKANLAKTNLENMDLSRTNLVGADLSGTNLTNADLTDTDLSGADLGNAILNGADLLRAGLANAKLLGSSMVFTNLGYADLSFAHLTGANLRSAKLNSAKLRGADLTEADLSAAVMLDANIAGANLKNAKGLTQDQVDSAHGDQTTQLPRNILRPPNWNTLRSSPAPQYNQKPVVLRGVHFDFNKSTIRPGDAAVLDEDADTLKANPNVVVYVDGYSDSIGSKEYDLKLSERQVDSVINYLIAKGISPSRLIPRGFGKTNFVAQNDTAEGRAQNRRVELVPKE